MVEVVRAGLSSIAIAIIAAGAAYLIVEWLRLRFMERQLHQVAKLVEEIESERSESGEKGESK